MRVVGVDTLRLGEFPNLLFVEVRTDEGLVGLGETFFGARVVEAYVHETAAPYLLGADPLEIEAHAAALEGYVGYGGTGAERRGASAVDIALWDLLGQASGMPLYRLLGGRVRQAVPVYNTCAGYRYVRERPTQSVDNWGVPAAGDGGAEGPYEDLEAFLHDAGTLAESLLSEGVRAMKIWPFDLYAEQTGGAYIAAQDLDRALEPFRKIRDAVGDRIEILVELHGLWTAATARQILTALEEFAPYWVEDPIRPDNLAALASLARSTPARIAVGETRAGLRAFHDLIEREAADVLIVDPAWAGGVTVARKIAALAETSGLPICFHDCTGPVVLSVAAHLAVATAGTPMQETVRAHHSGWYRELAAELPPIDDGMLWPLDAPGHGISLAPGLHERSDAAVSTSRLDGFAGGRGELRKQVGVDTDTGAGRAA